MWSQPLLDKDHAGSITSLPHICERSLTTLNLLFRVSFQVWLNLHAKVYHIDLLRSLGGILLVCRHWEDVGGGTVYQLNSLEFPQSWHGLLPSPVYVEFTHKGHLYTSKAQTANDTNTKSNSAFSEFMSCSDFIALFECTYDQTSGSRTDQSRCIWTSQFYNTNIQSESEVTSTSLDGMDGSWKPSWKMYWQDSELKSAFRGYF